MQSDEFESEGDIEVAGFWRDEVWRDGETVTLFGMSYVRSGITGEIRGESANLHGMGCAVWRLDAYLSSWWFREPKSAYWWLEEIGRQSGGCRFACVTTDSGVLVGLFSYHDRSYNSYGLVVLDADGDKGSWVNFEE